MQRRQIDRVVEHLRHIALACDGAAPTDVQLLERFLARREEAAFEAIVRRHGSMVLGVCRRVLRNAHDAEDAFQATFLVLARSASSIRSRHLLANWLYGVAYQTALKARIAVIKRQARERAMNDMTEIESGQQERAVDWQPVLDQELSALPEKYRLAIVLCDLEGKTRKDAAEQIGVPEGTLNSRLARSRRMLANRLARHGVIFSGGAIAVALSQDASASVPVSLVGSTVKAASLIAAGEAMAASVVSAEVAALARGVLSAMLISKLKVALVLIIVIAVLGASGGVLVRGALVRQTQATVQPPADWRDARPTVDLTGSWQGDGRGTVVSQRTTDGGFDGTNSDTGPPEQGNAPFPIEVYQDFRGKPLLDDFRLDGPNHIAVTTFEDVGLRITLPRLRKVHQPVQVAANFVITGDFEITGTYELLSADMPTDGYGVGVALNLATTNDLKTFLKVSRVMRADKGSVFMAEYWTKGANDWRGPQQETGARSGQLRLVREGMKASCQVSEAIGQEFRTIFEKDDFTTDDIAYLRFQVADGNTPGNAVDARLVDLRVRHGRPTVKAAVPLTSTEPQQNGPQPSERPVASRGRLVLLLVLGLSALILAGVLYLLIHLVRRRARQRGGKTGQ